jgi:hypothetical protein
MKSKPPDAAFESTIGRRVLHARFGDGVVLEIQADRVPQAAHIDFGSLGLRWIDLSGGHLRASQTARHLLVLLSNCRNGWLTLSLEQGMQRVEIDISDESDFFANLMKWLEALTTGVHLCGFDFEGITGYRAFEAYGDGRPEGKVRFRVGDGLDWAAPEVEVFLEVRLPLRELVEQIYREVCDFSMSPSYLAKHWEAAASAGLHNGFPLRECRSPRIEEWLDEVRFERFNVQI